MRVVKGIICAVPYMETIDIIGSTIPDAGKQLLCEGISVNSKANLIPSEDKSREFEVQGNKTESALLILVQKNLAYDYKQVRNSYEEKKHIAKLYTFSSEKKRMSVIININGSGNYRLHTKGASEIVLDLCSSYIDKDGQVAQLSAEKKQEFEKAIFDMATQGLRTICLAYKDLPADSESLWEDQVAIETNLTCIGIVGIKDPLRPEVKAAVEQCKKSGIIVRMVTGDNVLTAQHIARECGILDDDGIAIEGPKFRQMSVEEIDAILPKLRVMARSSPTDKFTLVKRLRHHKEVVAVTGDGTNDAPALKEADVGLAMGISGTQVAKEAADIIIMDDNFTSIVKSVLWGRSIFESMLLNF